LSAALVPFGWAHRNGSSSALGQRPRADFLAHLIAAKALAPQTRSRRRTEPQAAIAAYRALGQWPTAPGGTVSRSV
jgi:hypothetical protein